MEQHDEQFAVVLVAVSRSPAFEKVYERGDVMLFKRRLAGASEASRSATVQ